MKSIKKQGKGNEVVATQQKMKKCSITGKMYDGYGNNAYPFEGRCSDYANSMYVIPARLMGITPKQIKLMGKKAIMTYIDMTVKISS